MRPFRFGFQSRARDLDSLLTSARRAESAGFDVFHTFDHFGVDFSALAPLVAVAGVTQRLRLCPLVLYNDRRRWGISYYSVRDVDAFAPVIERLRHRPEVPGLRASGSDTAGVWPACRA